MAQNIDFLPELTEDEIRQGKYTKRINFVAVISLLVMGAILLGVFGYWLFLAANAERIQSQTASAEQEILSQSRKEITRRSLVDRLEQSKRFVDTVIPYSTAVQKILSFFNGTDVILTENDFQGARDLTIGGEFEDPARFNSLVNRFISEEEAENFEEVTLVSLTRETDDETGEAGNYVFSLGVSYLKRGISGATVSSQIDQ